MKQGNGASITKTVLNLVLFFSGVSALVYQVIWIRKFGLVFGVDVYTMATVLTAFMGGLAAGSIIFGRLADKMKNPLLLFMLLEFGIGIFAVTFHSTFNGLINLYTPVIQNYNLSAYSAQLVKFLFSFCYLLIPTTLMGGTLPVIFKFFVKRLNNLGWHISRLYSINNLGAVTGCFLAGFILIKSIGITASLYVAASLNILNALAVLLVSSEKPVRKTTPDSGTNSNIINPDNKLSKPLLRLVLWVFALEGFTTLAFEVIWTRIFIGFSYDKTTYFSSVIVMGVIFGLSLGSIIVSKIVDSRRNLVGILAALEVFIGLISMVLLIGFSKISLQMNLQRSVFEPWIKIIGKEYFVFFLILVIPATLNGMVYPIVSKLYADNIDKLGNRMGMIGFLDNIGSVVGSFVAGFILVPLIGVVRSYTIVVAINIILGVLLISFSDTLSKRARTISLAGAFLATFLLMINTPAKRYFSWWDKSRYELWTNFVQKIPFYYEGVDGTVTLRQYNNYIALNINGHNTAYTTLKDQIVNRMLGYIPYMVHPHPERALVIGFGLGFTVESLVQPEINTVDVAEICTGVIKSGLFMNDWNNDVLNNPVVHTYLEDGRELLFKTKEKYDIITSNAVHPRLSNNIYTQDFYELCNEKMNKGGIMCQWATPNWLNEREFKAQIRSFVNAFSYAQLWYINEYTIILIGSDERINIDYQLITERFTDDKVKADLLKINMTQPYEFVAQFSMEKDELMKYCDDVPANTDDFPLVEFSKTVNIAPDTSALQFIYDTPDNYGIINFGPDIADSVKNNLLKKIETPSAVRKRIVKETIENVKYQVREYKRTGKAPVF